MSELVKLAMEAAHLKRKPKFDQAYFDHLRNKDKLIYRQSRYAQSPTAQVDVKKEQK